MIATLLVASAVLAAPDAAAPRITPEALRAHYAGIERLTADVVQVKEGKYWAKPFESRVKLRYTPERVEWETVAPVKSLATIDGGGMRLVGPDGKAKDLGPMAGDPRLAALLRFVRALLAVDLPGIERDFVLTYGPGEVTATPRPDGALAFFTGVRLGFAPDLEIATVDLETPQEKTHLRFEHVEHAPAGAAP